MNNFTKLLFIIGLSTILVACSDNNEEEKYEIVTIYDENGEVLKEFNNREWEIGIVRPLFSSPTMIRAVNLENGDKYEYPPDTKWDTRPEDR